MRHGLLIFLALLAALFCSSFASTAQFGHAGYGQLTNEQIYLGGALQNAFAQGWDAGGRRNALQAPTAAFGYAYQADGRMTGVTAFGATCNFGYANNGLLSSRNNPWRTLTVNTRDGQGRLLQQTATVGSGTPLVETLTWRPDSTLASYTATRTGTGAWNDARTYQYNARGQLTSEPVGVNSSTLVTNHFTFDSGQLGVRVGAQESGALTNGWTGQLNPLAQVTSEAWNESSQILRASGSAVNAGSVAASLDGTAVGATLGNGRWYADLTAAPGSHALAASAYYPAGQFTAAVTNAFTVLGTNNVTEAFDGAGYVTNRAFASGKTQALTWDAAGRLIGLTQWNSPTNGFFWTAIYDALGRRLRTSYVTVINGYTNTPLASTVDAYFDPQVEFEEVGVSLNGQRTWKVLGPDLDGHYGSLQGVGGLEATVRESDGLTTPVLNDYCGNVLATIAGTAATWNSVRVGGYGPVAGYQASPLLGSTPLADTLVWRSRGMDPGGFYNLGARYYDPVAGHFLSPDPLGHAASMDLYSFCSGDPLNRFDPTGRFGKGNFEQGMQELQTAGKQALEAGREFDLAHEDEIQQTLLAVDDAAVCFALPVVAEGLLSEGMGAGAGMALEEGEIGGVEGFNLRSAQWAASLEESEGAAATFTAEGQGEFAFMKDLAEAPAAVEEAALAETEAAATAEAAEGSESVKVGSQGEQLEFDFEAEKVGSTPSRNLDLEDWSGVDYEARNAAADAEWETQNPSETATTAQDLASAANRAAQTVGPGRGAVYGTKVHSAFEKEVNALGHGNLSTEVSYLNGQVVLRGTPGSVRLDVVEGPRNAPTAVYDLKTGSAALTPTRIQQIQSHVPGGAGVPVSEIRP